MSFINAIDKTQNMTPSKQYGENNHIEHGWVTVDKDNLSETIVQIFFQLVRTKDTTKLEQQISDILQKYKNSSLSYIKQNISHLNALYKLIGHTRDIINGKGEYELTYMQIYTWYNYFPQLAFYALEKMVLFPDMYSYQQYNPETHHNQHHQDEHIHPYGSWKDIKYFCDYVYKRTNDKSHPLINFGIGLLETQLRKDIYQMEQGEDKYSKISLVSKWIPREKSKHSWIFKKLAQEMRPEYFTSAKSRHSLKDATKKSHRELRKLLTSLNKIIDTTQIKMAGKNWSSIDFNKVTSQTMNKNRLAFMNKTKSNEERYDVFDRIQCAENLTNHIDEVKKENTNKKLHGKRVGVYELVKSAILSKSDEEKDIVNLQWKDNAKQNHALGNFIPMADTSGSMYCNNHIPLYNSIGLSIRISELANDAFKNRILTFSSHPEWVNLDNIEQDNFVEKVRKVEKADWGMNTNFYGAMKMILDSMITNNVDPDTVKDLVLVVFSDMQIDAASQENTSTMYENIQKMYHNAGLKTEYKTPYNPPHILFWNLRSTTGFPTLSTQKNVTMLSGYSPVLLNIFSEKGLDGLREYTPGKMLYDLLHHERYKPMEKFLYKFFD